PVNHNNGTSAAPLNKPAGHQSQEKQSKPPQVADLPVDDSFQQSTDEPSKQESKPADDEVPAWELPPESAYDDVDLRDNEADNFSDDSVAAAGDEVPDALVAEAVASTKPKRK